ncbi:hypothetical protein ACXYN8_10045 [Altererythrobacter sp. CAU 1778]
MNTKLACLPALPLLLAGCMSYGNAAVGEFDPEAFGEANRQTYAAMVVDPDPQYDEPLATSADKAAQAVDRYNTDTVKEPDTIRSTEGVGDGGSGN